MKPTHARREREGCFAGHPSGRGTSSQDMVTRTPAWSQLGTPDNARRRRGRCACCKRPPMRFCITWAGFVFLLTWTCLLYRPTIPPSTRYVGYQAFDILASPHNIAKPQEEINEASEGQGTPSGAAATPVTYGPTFPNDIYAPLVPNTFPLTEITVHQCFRFGFEACRPPSTAAKDARLGPWVRVDRPLDSESEVNESKDKGNTLGGGVFGNIFGSLESRYLFYRRSKRTSDVPNVVEVRLVELGTDQNPKGGEWAGWHRVKTDLCSHYMRIFMQMPPLHLYFRTVGGTDEDRVGIEAGEYHEPSTPGNAAAQRPITELDVVYGNGPPWPSFEVVGQVAPYQPEFTSSGVTLTARRDPIPNPTLPVHPLFKTDGTFKIVQLADMHFSVTHGDCREVDWASDQKVCVADDDTNHLIGQWLDEEKPDLVVWSGDQLNGQGSSWDVKSVLPKVLKEVIDRKIPWAAIQGNHDSQSGHISRVEQQRMLSLLPYSLTKVGPASLHDGEGAGNFYIEVHSPTPDDMHLFTLYFADSGIAAPREKWKPWKWNGYDWIRKDQIDWFLQVSAKWKKIARPYMPDGAKDLGRLWKVKRKSTTMATMNAIVERQKQAGGAAAAVTAPSSGGEVWDAQASKATHLAKPKALFFCHIPIPEAFAPVDKDASTGAKLEFGTEQESATFEGGQKYGGIFDAIVAQPAEDRDVIGFFHGHMHINAACKRVTGLWVCLNGGSSFAGYGKLGFPRRTRVIELQQWGERVKTWHRYEGRKERIDENNLYEETSSS